MFPREREAYLEEPVAAAVKGGQDGGVYVAAVDTLNINMVYTTYGH
jgi:hypothetical protein